jgi:hypothetical protein
MLNLGFSQLSFPQAFRQVYRADNCPEADVPPPAIEAVEALFLQWPLLMLASGTPLDECRPGLWTIAAASGLPVFTFLTEEAQRVAAVVFPIPKDRIGVHALWHWRRAREFWFCETDGWRRKDAEATLLRHLYHRTFRRFFGVLPRCLAVSHHTVQEAFVKQALAWRGRSELPEAWYPQDRQSSQALWVHWIDRDNLAFPGDASRRTGRHLRATHYLTALSFEGAAGRLIELASKQAKQGHAVEVLTADATLPGQAQFAALLSAEGIACRRADGRTLSVRAGREVDWELLRAAPPAVREPAFHLTGELLRNWPDVLHCWLHPATIVGAMAGFVADVPRIVLHVLNTHPGASPISDVPHLHAWYAILARSGRVQFLADSRGAATAWASWIGIPESSVQVLRDGTATCELSTPAGVSRRTTPTSFTPTWRKAS